MLYHICDSYDPHIYPHSVTISTSSGAACRPRAPGSTSPAHSRRSTLSYASEGSESWTWPQWPHLHFCGSKKLWSMEMSKVRTCDSDQNTIFDSLPADFFAFNLDVMSQLGFPLSGCEKCQRDNPILLARRGVNCKPCCSYGWNMVNS